MMGDKIIVKDKESFKAGVQYAFVMASLLHEDFGINYWYNIDGNEVLSDEFKNEISDNIFKYFDDMIKEEEKNNWPDYEFKADNSSNRREE